RGEVTLVPEGIGEASRVLRVDVSVAFRHLDRRRDGTGPVWPHDEVHLVFGDQPLVECRRLVGYGLVVQDPPFHRPTQEPAVGVQPLGEQVTDHLVDRGGRGPRPGERQRAADDDGVARRGFRLLAAVVSGGGGRRLTFGRGGCCRGRVGGRGGARTSAATTRGEGHGQHGDQSDHSLHLVPPLSVDAT